jgi:RNA polymerase sigma-70 factor (ECF subfamily)
VHERVPDQSQQATLERLGDERARALVARYMEAIEHADVEGLVGLLTEDAAWAMPPMSVWYRGREAVAAFHTEHVLAERWRHLPARASGQLAVGCYMWDDEQARYAAGVLDVLTLRGDRIAEVTGFVNPALFARFGLPAALDD